MQILVTGAAGFIGGQVCRRLLKQGQRVTGLDCLDPYYDLAQKRATLEELQGFPGFRWIQGDVRDATVMDAALENATGVIHLAARPGVRASLIDPKATFAMNLEGTLGVLEGMRRAELRCLVFASSSSVYGDDTPYPFREDVPACQPMSPYAASKRSCEMLLQSYASSHGFGAMALRFFTVYGPFGRPDMAIGRFAQLMLEGGTATLFGDGSAVRDFTYIDDTVDGVLRALERVRPGHVDIVNIGGGEQCSMSELIAIMEECSGLTLNIERRPTANGDMPRTQSDPHKAAELLGWTPQVTLREGIERTFAWARERHES